jgi:hypothetical protein
VEKLPFIRGKNNQPPGTAVPNPVVLRKHGTTLPIPKIRRIEPGRTLLIPQRADGEREAIARVWEAAGGKVHRVRRIWEPDPSFKEQCVCVYGNAIFCQVLADSLSLQLLGPPDDFLARLPKELLGRSVIVDRLDNAPTLSYPSFFKSLPAKLFTSGIVSSVERLQSLTSGLGGDTGLLVSEVVRFEAQARAFIYDQRVLDCTVYRGHSQLDPVIEMAEAVAKLENTPFGFVVDLGKLGERWVVVKVHPAWGARLKGCDPDKVVLSIAAATRA